MKVLLTSFTAALLSVIQLQAQVPDFRSNSNHFKKADSIAALYPRHPLKDLKSLSDKLTQSLSTEEEKFRAIYTWVCNNIENDYGFYLKNKSKREKLQGSPDELNQWNQKFAPLVFQKLLNEHKTVCTGYASLVKSLANHAGIECEIINGYGRTIQANIGGTGIPNHSWNAVELDGQWYLCDATWSSGSIDVQLGKFQKEYNDGYFLSAPELFVLNHYPLDTAWLLIAQKPTLPEFLNRPLVYKKAFNFKVIPISPETFQITAYKGETLAFRFNKESLQKIEKVELQIIHGGSVKSILPKVQQDSNDIYMVNHTFSAKGAYVVHLLLNGDYIFSYEIVVLKSGKKVKGG